VSPNCTNRPVFDASAVLALTQGEPGADKLRNFQAGAVANAVNAADVVAKLVSRGMPPAEAQAAYDALHLDTAPFESGFLAAAHRHGPGWTSDRDLGSLFGSSVRALKFFR